ncbi:hypothetical protein [Marinobacter sp. MDS2]|uniref:hypothetical protein n=1 Tax=Marinobacter sp. MDS2 TaxID=3065961 RepID=UPI00273B9403|nr:hypothetical protein [Marinobacter sp. MDS2]MDP4546517.1 hypothetical protein [Marinobacter sp. MDS2]
MPDNNQVVVDFSDNERARLERCASLIGVSPEQFIEQTLASGQPELRAVAVPFESLKKH